jgi:hypothetical protein
MFNFWFVYASCHGLFIMEAGFVCGKAAMKPAVLRWEINPSMWSDEYTRTLRASYASERQVYSQCAVPSSFAYNVNDFGDIVLIFAPFCRYSNGVLVQIKTFVPSPLLQLSFTTDFSKSFSELLVAF